MLIGVLYRLFTVFTVGRHSKAVVIQQAILAITDAAGSILRTVRLANSGIQLGNIFAHILQGSFQTGSLCRSSLCNGLAFHRLRLFFFGGSSRLLLCRLRFCRSLGLGFFLGFGLRLCLGFCRFLRCRLAYRRRSFGNCRFPAQPPTKQPPMPQRKPIRIPQPRKRSFLLLPRIPMPEASHRRALHPSSYSLHSFCLFLLSILSVSRPGRRRPIHRPTEMLLLVAAPAHSAEDTP